MSRVRRKVNDSRSRSNVRAFEWMLLQNTRGKVAPREDINEKLVEENLKSISPRSYKHIKVLLKNGITEYMTINGFDQWRKEQRGEDTAPSRDPSLVVESCASAAKNLAKKMGLSEVTAEVFYKEVKKVERVFR